MSSGESEGTFFLDLVQKLENDYCTCKNSCWRSCSNTLQDNTHWNSIPIPCVTAIDSMTPVPGLHVAPNVCISVGVPTADAFCRGYKKLLQNKSSQKVEFEHAYEEEAPSSGALVYVTTHRHAVENITIVTGRNSKPQRSGAHNQPSTPEGKTTEPQGQRDISALPHISFGNPSPLKRNPSFSRQTSHPDSLRNSTNPSVETVVINLCPESKALLNTCTENYGSMVLQLESLIPHVCSTQHCQAVLLIEFGLGLAYYKNANYHLATKHFANYKSLAHNQDSRGDISLAHMYLGDIAVMRCDYISAADHYLNAIKTHGASNAGHAFKLVMPSMSTLYTKQGAALKQSSQMIHAVEAYRNAILQAPDNKSRLAAHNSLGNTLQSVGDYAGAVTEYKASIELSEELQDLVSLGWSHGNIGNAHLGLQQKDLALFHLKKSLELTIKHEHTPQAIGRAYNNLGTAYQSLENLALAEESYKSALDQAIYGNDAPGQARARGNLGNLLMLSKDYKGAVEQYSEVFTLTKDKQMCSTARHNRGCAYYEWAEQISNDAEKTDIALKYYKYGVDDLTSAIDQCNEVLNSTKGSMEGLSLSVALIENNSRTFHRLQDCLVCLQQMKEALVVAEQCRARTLGERLLEKMGGVAGYHLTPPLSLEHIRYIVGSQECPVVYLSYTGARLIIWLIVPSDGHAHIDCQVIKVNKLEKDKFEGKTFDQYVRQSTQEAVLGSDIELFHDVFSAARASPITVLFDVVVVPILDMLKKNTIQHVKKLILIPDSYTTPIPFVALHPQGDSSKTFGSTFYIQMMPSLLVMGILNEVHQTSMVVYDDNMTCVIGNPHIPIFKHNEEEWSLGRLPHATEEAKWISRRLKAVPILHEEATKTTVLTKLVSAQLIHIATHGSAVSGFLAFAGHDSLNGQPSKAEDILLFPSEVEKLNIRAAIVVLSSCDSGRGTVRADGIIGMGRAFLLAGAQSVLTTLWRIPDESAGMFMQFFYQYLVDGLGTTEALQKATLSVRCFKKYSQYVHWGGFQLIGRETHLNRRKTSEEEVLAVSLGPVCAFPQAAVVEQLEQNLIQTEKCPSDVQVLWGYEGTDVSDPVQTFIHAFYGNFRGGIFWINCRSKDVVAAGVENIMKVVKMTTCHDPVLVVLDNMFPDTFSSFSSETKLSRFVELLRHARTRIVATVSSGISFDLSTVVRQIDLLLIRGANLIEVHPLSPIQTTQRIVYSHVRMSKCHPPSDEDRAALETLVDFSKGSPAVIDIMTSKGMTIKYPESLSAFACRLCIPEQPVEPSCYTIDDDLWGAVIRLVKLCELTSYEEIFLNVLSVFHGMPVPVCVVENLSNFIQRSCGISICNKEICQKLMDLKLLSSYPQPVVLPSKERDDCYRDCVWEEKESYYVTPSVATAVWNWKMNDTEKVMALGIVYKVFEGIYSSRFSVSCSDLQCVTGLACAVLELCGNVCYLFGEECYQLLYIMTRKLESFSASK